MADGYCQSVKMKPAKMHSCYLWWYTWV